MEERDRREGWGEDRRRGEKTGDSSRIVGRGEPQTQSSAEVKTLAAGGEWCLNSPEFKIHPEFSLDALPSCYILLNT